MVRSFRVKAGSLVDVCLDLLVKEKEKEHNVDVRRYLEPSRFDGRTTHSLNRFLRNIRLIMNRKHPRYGQLTRGGMRKESVIESIELKGAKDYTFNNEQGNQLSVKVQYYVPCRVCCLHINQWIQEYFGTLGKNLDYPTIICIRLKAQHGDVVVPLE